MNIKQRASEREREREEPKTKHITIIIEDVKQNYKLPLNKGE